MAISRIFLSGVMDPATNPAAGIAAWDILSPMVDKWQAHLEQNNKTLQKIDAWLGAHSGGMLATQTPRIEVILDGKKVGEAVGDHLQKAHAQNMRATGTAFDPRKDIQYPGRSVGY